MVTVEIPDSVVGDIENGAKAFGCSFDQAATLLLLVGAASLLTIDGILSDVNKTLAMTADGSRDTQPAEDALERVEDPGIVETL
jgi:hypothetical protein